jgi:hypothetical protein
MEDDDDVLNYEWDDALKVPTCTYSRTDEAIATVHACAHIHRILNLLHVCAFSASLETRQMSTFIHAFTYRLI